MNLKTHSVSKLNILTTLCNQLVSTICGIVIPRVMIASFGSAAYGLTTSISQFLSYISLLEGGISQVARAELYAPLARKDDWTISRIYQATRHFFRWVGIVFLGYTLVLALGYYDLADVRIMPRGQVFCLVWIISIHSIAKYLSGLSNLTLMFADRKQYVGYTIIMSTTILNTGLVVLLSGLGCNLMTVKLGSALTYVLQPVCYSIYVRRTYRLPHVGSNRAKLEQKWTGLGQHMAYFLHTNTDVILLTLFCDIRLVAVYSVYWMVISSIRRIAGSFTASMEADFGELYAKERPDNLRRAFHRYKELLCAVTVVLFGTTAVMIVPFVRLYTAGITDADYIQPLFAMLLLLAEAVDLLMHPCASLSVASNRLRQTRWGSYAEAAINIVLSLLLIRWNPLAGIAIGTLTATLFKGVYYMVYAARHILQVPLGELVKYLIRTLALLCLCAVPVFFALPISNFPEWMLFAAGSFTLIAAVSAVCFPGVLKTLLKKGDRP